MKIIFRNIDIEELDPSPYNITANKEYKLYYTKDGIDANPCIKDDNGNERKLISFYEIRYINAGIVFFYLPEWLTDDGKPLFPYFSVVHGHDIDYYQGTINYLVNSIYDAKTIDR